ncbi:MAG: amidohydrolase [Gemmatimonadota bacterium]
MRSPTSPRRLAALALPLAILLGLAACAAEPENPADLVLTGGHVVTVDEAVPEAEAVAVKDGRILALGTAEEIGAYVGSATRVVDLAGRTVVPGFIEGHGHYTSLGETKLTLDLTGAGTWDDIVALVGEAAATAEPGAWIVGWGWHQERWSPAPSNTVDGVPLHAGLSAVSPDNPVFLTHASGHAAFANARAMELAGITRSTPDPDGGTIVKDGAGNPTGLLRENADALVGRVLAAHMDARSDEEKWEEFVRVVELAGQEALSKGVTSFHDAGSNFATIDGFKRLADEGRLPVRLYVMVRFESNDAMREKLPAYRMVGYGNDFLTVRSIKRQIDGALGSHGAWLLEPYADLPTSTGLAVEPPSDIEETTRIALELGYQVNTHAIGDRANREVLDIYQRTFAGAPDPGGLRWRIEHAQHVDPADLPRFAELGVIAAMQGVHCTSDAPWVFRRLGAERAESGAYMWRDFIDAGVVVGNGTDVPVEDISPIASYTSSVVRRDRDGNEFFPAQEMTRMEALRSYTINNAFAAFEEDLKGSLTPGKLADLVVLDREILTVPDEELPMTRVDMTIVGGRVAFERAR